MRKSKNKKKINIISKKRRGGNNKTIDNLTLDHREAIYNHLLNKPNSTKLLRSASRSFRNNLETQFQIIKRLDNISFDLNRFPNKRLENIQILSNIPIKYLLDRDDIYSKLIGLLNKNLSENIHHEILSFFYKKADILIYKRRYLSLIRNYINEGNRFILELLKNLSPDIINKNIPLIQFTIKRAVGFKKTNIKESNSEELLKLFNITL